MSWYTVVLLVALAALGAGDVGAVPARPVVSSGLGPVALGRADADRVDDLQPAVAPKQDHRSASTSACTSTEGMRERMSGTVALRASAVSRTI